MDDAILILKYHCGRLVERRRRAVKPMSARFELRMANLSWSSGSMQYLSIGAFRLSENALSDNDFISVRFVLAMAFSQLPKLKHNKAVNNIKHFLMNRRQVKAN